MIGPLEPQPATLSQHEALSSSGAQLLAGGCETAGQRPGCPSFRDWTPGFPTCKMRGGRLNKQRPRVPTLKDCPSSGPKAFPPVREREAMPGITMRKCGVETTLESNTLCPGRDLLGQNNLKCLSPTAPDGTVGHTCPRPSEACKERQRRSQMMKGPATAQWVPSWGSRASQNQGLSMASFPNSSATLHELTFCASVFSSLQWE